MAAVAGALALGQLNAAASPQPDPGLWLIGADGTGAREVAPDVDHGFGYDWSPDGDFLVYATGDIWVLDVTAGEARNVTATPIAHEAQPVWSPDGSRLAFTRDGDIWVADADGSDGFPLTGGAASDRAPSWAPAGDLIAFERFVEGEPNPTLHVVGAGGGPERPLVEVAPDLRPVSWSPDGREIAYSSPARDVRVVDVTTGAVSVLANAGFSPAWSPAGDRIAYGYWDGVYVVSRTGDGPRRLREGGSEWGDSLSWSPDGRSIAAGGYELQVIDATTGSSTVLTAGQPTEEEYAPLWSPTGDLIAYVGQTWCCLPDYWPRQVEAAGSGHLVMRGRVDSPLSQCAGEVVVNVRRRFDGRWRTIRRAATAADGSFRIRVPDRPGRYLVVTPRERVVLEGAEYTCLRSRSAVVTHRH